MGCGTRRVTVPRSDVLTLLDLARLIRARQPKLFDYHLSLRDPAKVTAATQGEFLWVSSLIPAARHCTSLLMPLVRSTDKDRLVAAYDLYHDPRPFASFTVKELLEYREAQGFKAWPVYSIKKKESPFVVGADLLRQTIASSQLEERAVLDLERMRSHLRVLRSNPQLKRRLYEAWKHLEDARRISTDDVDLALYDGFVSHSDYRTLEQARRHDPALSDLKRLADRRLPELHFRFRARNYPETLTSNEMHRWTTHCHQRHLTAGFGRSNRYGPVLCRNHEPADPGTSPQCALGRSGGIRQRRTRSIDRRRGLIDCWTFVPNKVGQWGSP